MDVYVEWRMQVGYKMNLEEFKALRDLAVAGAEYLDRNGGLTNDQKKVSEKIVGTYKEMND